MASMFGGFYYVGQVVQGSPGPSSGPGGGGFPGIFPAGGVGNSGFAGFGTFGKVGPCTPEDVRTGACVMGPRMEFLGKHH
jgi:hypothetical protein